MIFNLQSINTLHETLDALEDDDDDDDDKAKQIWRQIISSLSEQKDLSEEQAALVRNITHFPLPS